MRSTRTTSRQRPLARVTGLGPQSAATRCAGEHGVRAAPVAARAAPPRARGRARPRTQRSCRAARARARAPSAPSPRPRRRRPRRASRRRPPPRPCSLRSACGSESTASWPLKQVCQARMPLRDSVEARELGERVRRGPDVAGREQRLAPVERELGARGVGRVEAVERAPEQARRRAAGRRARAPVAPRSRGGGRRARRARERSRRAAPSSRRCWNDCSRCQPIVSSWSAGSGPAFSVSHSAKRAWSSARVSRSGRR